MRLWCYGVDQGNWGQQIVQMAAERGMEARLFTEVTDDIEPGDCVFLRIPQWDPELTKGKDVAIQLAARRCILVPDLVTCMQYENKITQTALYQDWMPTTHLLRRSDSIDKARRVARSLQYPFISKSMKASASVNVRMIHTWRDAMAEYNAVFFGDGLGVKIGLGRTGTQRGYLIWQKFCDANPCDYRVVITGSHMMMLQRHNAHGTFFASGSGRNNPVNAPNAHESRALKKARDFFSAHNMRWCGIDLVYDWDEKDWKVLETTLGWSQTAYKDCVYFGAGGMTGKDMFELFLAELEAGVFV